MAYMILIQRNVSHLKISEEKLNRIRKERLKQLGLGDTARYATEARIQEELNYFEEIVSEIGCPVIDVSQKQSKKQQTI